MKTIQELQMEEKQAISFIKSKHRPTMKLYRYFSNIEYAIEEILSGTIYCPLSDTFNDIFDCRVTNDISILDKDIEGEVSSIIKYVDDIWFDCEDLEYEFFACGYSYDKMQEEFSKKLSDRLRIKPSEYLRFIHDFSERKDEYSNFYNILRTSYLNKHPVISLCKRVACFSEVNDSILMWSYYANKHKGVCLEYDPTLLDNGIEENQNLLNAIQKVQYSETQYNNPKYFRSADDINNVFFTKALCWTHEQEWRFVLNDDIERIKFPCLTGAYMGARFSQEYNNTEKEKIYNKFFRSCIKRNIPIYDAFQDSEKYKINFYTYMPASED